MSQKREVDKRLSKTMLRKQRPSRGGYYPIVGEYEGVEKIQDHISENWRKKIFLT